MSLPDLDDEFAREEFSGGFGGWLVEENVDGCLLGNATLEQKHDIACEPAGLTEIVRGK